MSVQLTTNISIIAQLASFVALGGLGMKVAPRDEILKELIKVEMGVQAIEFGFYATLLRGLSTSNVGQMAQTRYYDWVLTTPTMLFTTINYLAYEKYPDRTLTVSTVWEENREVITTILVANLMMLIVGYLGETGRIQKSKSIALGFLFLLMSFGQMYECFVKDSTEDANRIFTAMFFVWSLYGFAAMLEEDKKNISYNFLDIFAKNFFGVFLYLKVRSLRIN
jgi:bacteriorhodopsin